MKMNNSVTHLVDDAIYLNEDRFSDPKELFKFLGDLIGDCQIKDNISLLDVGCATGEFLYYIGSRYSNLNLAGFDISGPMVEAAKIKNDQVDFWSGSILDTQIARNQKYEIVTNIGVLSFFDEKELIIALKNLLLRVKEGGVLFIHTMINPHPVDVIMKYRRAGSPDTDKWEGGWNAFSRATIEEILNSFNGTFKWTWFTWEMPFAIEKKSDPMRAWTIWTENNSFQRVNGASQIIHSEILKIKISREITA